MKNNYDLLKEFEAKCNGLGITWHMIYEMVDNYLKTGSHDDTLYPTFIVKKHSDEVLEIYDKLHGQYTMVMLFHSYNWRFFHVNKQDRGRIGPEQFNAFVEWFRQMALTS